MLKKIYVILLLAAIAVQTSSAAIIISNFDISPTEVSFDLSGEIDSGITVGPSSGFVLYIGVPSDSDWITANSFGNSVTNNGGSSVSLRTDSGANANDNTRGDNLQVQKPGAPASTWQVGDSVNATIVYTGSFIPGNLVIEDLIVSTGQNAPSGPLPDTLYQVGAIPEPATMACCLGLVSLMLVAVVRRRNT